MARRGDFCALSGSQHPCCDDVEGCGATIVPNDAAEQTEQSYSNVIEIIYILFVNSSYLVLNLSD